MRATQQAPPRSEILAYVDRSFPGAEVTALAGDASRRRFYRIRPADGPSRVLMDHGRPFPGETDDARLARIFEAAGLRVARIFDVSPSVGCLLLEDLGDRSLESALADGRSRRELLERTVRLAAAVATRGTPALADSPRAGGPALDREKFRFEMDFYVEHYAGSFLGRRRLPDALAPALHRLADSAAETPRRVLCHRDFHSRNLMLLPDGELAMVDIQDARWGPDTYDLASLLRDAYLDIAEDEVARLVAVFLDSLPEPPRTEAFERRLQRVAAQRMIKALGTFGYQIAVRGRESYRSGIPRTLARLRNLLPQLEETGELYELMVGDALL